MKKILALIVEDEARSILTLQKLLTLHCPQVEVISAVSNVEDAIIEINKIKPDLVFLDIELPDGDGFEILKRVDYKGFEVIFVTAFDQYAVKAFEMSALHYLLKPINYLELQNAIERYGKLNNSEDLLSEKISILKDNLYGNRKRLILPDTNGLQIIEINEIIRCEADHNYTTCYLLDNRKLTITKSLSKFQSILDDLNFSRVHSKHMVNLKYIKKYKKGAGGSIIMHDNSEISVSKNKKNKFLEKLNSYARGI